MTWRAWLYALLDDDEPDQRAPYQPVRGERWLLFGLVFFALLVRLLGLRMGLPFFHHWDEDTIAGSASSMLANGNDVPSSYFSGAPLMRLTAIAYTLTRQLELLAPNLSEGEALRWFSRILSTFISTSGVVAAYLAGRWTFGRARAALAAALLFAVAAELVWHARYGVSDASVTALTMWTLCATAAYLRHRSLATALLAVFAAGLTFAFKVNGLVAAGIPLGALALRPPLRSFGPRAIHPGTLSAVIARATLLGAVPLVFAVCFFFNPHYLDRQGHLPPYHDRPPGLPHLAAALHYLAFQALHTRWIASGLLALVSLFGLGISLARRSPLVWLGVVHAALLVGSMAFPDRAYLARVYLPALPILCLGFGAAWDRIASSLRETRVPLRPLAAAAVALLLIEPGYQALRTAQLGQDARTRALDFIAARARERGPVTVALTPSVAGAGAIGAHPAIGQALTRPGVRFLLEVEDAVTAGASGADYILVASFHIAAAHQPYQDRWPFRSAPGYRSVASFSHNPYEYRLEIAPWWNGRVSTLVLARSDIADRLRPDVLIDSRDGDEL